jgi:hypothetical protein
MLCFFNTDLSWRRDDWESFVWSTPGHCFLFLKQKLRKFCSVLQLEESFSLSCETDTTREGATNLRQTQQSLPESGCYCNALKLSSHSTHRMHPLNVTLLETLSTFEYSQQSQRSWERTSGSDCQQNILRRWQALRSQGPKHSKRLWMGSGLVDLVCVSLCVYGWWFRSSRGDRSAWNQLEKPTAGEIGNFSLHSAHGAKAEPPKQTLS